MSKYIGTNEQLCNALTHIGNRSVSKKTDRIISLEAAARIRTLEAELAARDARGVRVKPLGENDRAEITGAAYIAMRRHNRGVSGQTITEWDSIESWIISEAERRILTALEPAPVTVAEAAKVLLDPENQLALWDAFGKHGIISSVKLSAALRALADAGEAG